MGRAPTENSGQALSLGGQLCPGMSEGGRHGPALGIQRGTRAHGPRHEGARHLGLKGAEEVGEKGILPGECQHPLLHHSALHVVIHQYHVLLEGLNSEELSFALELCKQHLPVGGMLSRQARTKAMACPQMLTHATQPGSAQGAVGSRCPGTPVSQSLTIPHLPKAAFAQDLVESEVLDPALGAALPDLAVGPGVVCSREGVSDYGLNDHDSFPQSQGASGGGVGIGGCCGEEPWEGTGPGPPRGPLPSTHSTGPCPFSDEK